MVSIGTCHRRSVCHCSQAAWFNVVPTTQLRFTAAKDLQQTSATLVCLCVGVPLIFNGSYSNSYEASDTVDCQQSTYHHTCEGSCHTLSQNETIYSSFTMNEVVSDFSLTSSVSVNSSVLLTLSATLENGSGYQESIFGSLRMTLDVPDEFAHQDAVLLVDSDNSLDEGGSCHVSIMPIVLHMCLNTFRRMIYVRGVTFRRVLGSILQCRTQI